MNILDSWSSNVIDLMARRDFFFTQSMKSYGCLFKKAIS